MKHTQLTCLVTMLALTATSLPLTASEQLQVDWTRVCQVSTGHELLATTATGEQVSGYCVAVNVDEISISTGDQKIVKVGRSALAKLEMSVAKGHQVRSLGRGMHRTLKDGHELLLSPMAPVGIALIPATVAWGAAALPFCLLGDLRAKIRGKREIKPL